MRRSVPPPEGPRHHPDRPDRPDRPRAAVRHRRRRLGGLAATSVALATAGAVAVGGLPGWLGDEGGAHAAPAPEPRAWPEEADGFASLEANGQHGTYGGRDGETVTVTTEEELREYATAEEPYTIQVADTITYAEKGDEIPVASDKTIVGVGTSGEIVEGGFFLGEGTHNVIIRNLTIRDTYDGDWEGKDNDWDAIQLDGAHHVWIDHNHLTRMEDGLIDSRMDTTNLTVSWNTFSEHNKAFGIGWTDNVTAEITIHHNWFYETGQRNPSADNIAHAHLYNNYLQDDPDGDIEMAYGNYARGATKMVLENSYFENVTDPHFADPDAELVERGSVLENTSGRAETQGEAFDPAEFYDYDLDPAEDVPELLRSGAGPQPDIGVPDASAASAASADLAGSTDPRPADPDAPRATPLAPGTHRAAGHLPTPA